MTTTFTVDKSFAYIDRLTLHGSVFAACAGIYNRIILATRGASTVNITGVSAQLTAQPLDIVSNGTPSAYYVLTPKGITTLSAVTNPVITAESVFETGSNRWLFYSGGNLIAPTAFGGVRLQTTGGTVLTLLSGIVSECTAAAFANGVLYVFDGKRGKMAVVTVTATALVYEGTFDAPNCRDILRAVIDGTDLYCLNRNRVVRFSIATATSPILAQDYGKSAVEFTDVAIIATGKLWFGFLSSTPGVTGPEFFGPLYGVWDSVNQEIQTTAPRMSAWMVNNVVPYYTSTTIPAIIPTPPPAPIVPPVVVPPVVAPAAPVITSSLTASGLAFNSLSYTITATGMGPIFYDVISPPPWLTAINHSTGAISGTPTSAGSYSLTIRATNAGGSDTKTLVVTIIALANMSAVGVAGTTNDAVKVGSLLYIVGGFTQVYDSSGTKSRSNAACLDLATGLWTTWNPSPMGGTAKCIGYDGVWIYLGGIFTTVNGASRNYATRVHPTTGANDSWNPTLNGQVLTFLYDGTAMWVAGGFQIINASPRETVAKFDPLTGALSSWRAVKVLTPAYADRYLATNTGSNSTGLVDQGSSILILGGQAGLTQDVGGVHYLADSFISVDKITGAIALSAHRPNATLYGTSAIVGGLIYTACTNGISTYYNVAANTVAGAGFPTNQQITVSGTTIGTAFSPAFYDFDVDPVLAYCAVGSNILMGGTFTRLAGDTTKRFLQLMTPAGALVLGFTAIWGTASVSVNKLLDLGGGAVMVGGYFNGVNTLNGTYAEGIAFINGTTGARY